MLAVPSAHAGRATRHSTAIGFFAPRAFRIYVERVSLGFSKARFVRLLEDSRCEAGSLRLRKAGALLADPEFDGWRIGQIGYECGFSDLSYFNRCFRRRFGDTPAGVRSGRTLAV